MRDEKKRWKEKTSYKRKSRVRAAVVEKEGSMAVGGDVRKRCWRWWQNEKSIGNKDLTLLSTGLLFSKPAQRLGTVQAHDIHM